MAFLELDPAIHFKKFTSDWRKLAKSWVAEFDPGDELILNWRDVRQLWVNWVYEKYTWVFVPQLMHLPFAMWVLCRSTIKQGLEKQGWGLFPTLMLEPGHFLNDEIDDYVLARLPTPQDDKAHISLLADLAKVKASHSKRMAENGKKASERWLETADLWESWARPGKIQNIKDIA